MKIGLKISNEIRNCRKYYLKEDYNNEKEIDYPSDGICCTVGRV